MLLDVQKYEINHKEKNNNLNEREKEWEIRINTLTKTVLKWLEWFKLERKTNSRSNK